MQDTLARRISKKQALSESEKDSLLELLGKGCQAKTWGYLRRSINVIECLESYGIYDRITFEDEQASYCAGQSYPDEIRTVRKLVIGRG